ncbi:MAG: HAD-IA family hydrolase [Coriobacteriia bacterium]|nr:HAD-IA family hydrolase [Coriobacteriia bacterium]
MPVKAVVFDLDGTLLDSRELILDSYHYACDVVLGHRLADADLLDMVGVPLQLQMQKLVPEASEAMVKAYRENNHRRNDELIGYFAGTREALAKLRERGYPLAIVTSKLRAFALAGLKRYALEDNFEFLIGADDCPTYKPDPGPLLLAAERLAQDPQDCVYIGDSPYDMQAATAAGMYAVGAEWGLFDRERLLAAGAQMVLSTISEVPDAVVGLDR